MRKMKDRQDEHPLQTLNLGGVRVVKLFYSKKKHPNISSE